VLRISLRRSRRAIGFMMRVATELANTVHHAEWSNGRSRYIWVRAHDAGGVSPRDLALAARIKRFVPA